MDFLIDKKHLDKARMFWILIDILSGLNAGDS
jgi:hypothetical protein